MSRLLIGEALIRKEHLVCSTWGTEKAAKVNVRRAEIDVERRVSRVIGDMRFLWLAIYDEPGPQSRRVIWLEQSASLRAPPILSLSRSSSE